MHEQRLLGATALCISCTRLVLLHVFQALGLISVY